MQRMLFGEWRRALYGAAPRTNQILIGALMRGYSTWRETKKKEKGLEEDERREPSRFLSLELSFCFTAVHSDVYSSHVRLAPAETTIIIILRRDFRNFIFPTFHDVFSRDAHETRPRKPSHPRPRGRLIITST